MAEASDSMSCCFDQVAVENVSRFSELCLDDAVGERSRVSNTEEAECSRPISYNS